MCTLNGFNIPGLKMTFRYACSKIWIELAQGFTESIHSSHTMNYRLRLVVVVHVYVRYHQQQFSDAKTKATSIESPSSRCLLVQGQRGSYTWIL